LMRISWLAGRKAKPDLTSARARRVAQVGSDSVPS
jgi:hypothetical protein